MKTKAGPLLLLTALSLLLVGTAQADLVRDPRPGKGPETTPSGLAVAAGLVLAATGTAAVVLARLRSKPTVV